ncbi:MAG TPA: rRNA pseudouridine synthase [Firmicutes bacterium]|jgi:pseudouridine synthase|nr:rRNA pseudouridine synthase [Bacillota bacterium]
MQQINVSVRLQKFLASAGLASRRSAEKMIGEGRVRVNGEIVQEMGKKIDPREDRVEVDGIPISGPARKHYFLLYKPGGYLSTVKDPFGRPTVMDLFPPQLQKGLFPVGRLDLDTEGLLIMTNDGQLAHYLTHPRFQINKTYHALVRGIPSRSELQTLRKGLVLDGKTFLPARVKLLSAGKSTQQAKLEIVLAEGKKRQVRLMCKAVGHPVIFLKRVSLGFLTLGGLKPGSYRRLKKGEVDRLYCLAPE